MKKPLLLAAAIVAALSLSLPDDSEARRFGGFSFRSAPRVRTVPKVTPKPSPKSSANPSRSVTPTASQPSQQPSQTVIRRETRVIEREAAPSSSAGSIVTDIATSAAGTMIGIGVMNALEGEEEKPAAAPQETAPNAVLP